MRILYIHRTRGEGVEQVHIRGLVNGFRELGHEVDIVSPLGWEKEKSEHVTESYGIRKDRMFKAISKRCPEVLFEFLEILFNVQMYRYLRRIPLDTYQLFYERYAIFSVAGAYFASRKKIPFVLEVNYLATSPLVRKRNCLLRQAALKLEKYLVRKCTGIAVISSPIKSELIATGVDDERIILTPNAADPSLFDRVMLQKAGLELRSRFGIPSEGVVIGFVGGFYPWHGIPWLVKSLVPMMKNDRNIYLLLVGEGPDREIAVQIAESWGCKDNVIITGGVLHNEIPRYMAAMDVGVMPNSNSYGSPMKIFEYMSMEIPVVVPDLPPISDVITDGIEGYLFEPGNAEQIKVKMEKLIGSLELRKNIGAKGREKILRCHNWKNNSLKVLELVFNHENTRCFQTDWNANTLS